MTKVRIICGGEQFSAVLEEELAPKTCAIFKKMLPIKNQIIHVRWSGEGMWIPMGDTRWEGLTYENHTSYPTKGEMLIYPGGISEMEMILAQRPLRQQGGATGGKPFPHHHRWAGSALLAGAQMPVRRGTADHD